MPPKELKLCNFKFTHNKKRYMFDIDRIYDSDNRYVCRCDLTATNYYGNEEIMLICCKIALDAYLEGQKYGKIDGEFDAKRKIREALGL